MEKQAKQELEKLEKPRLVARDMQIGDVVAKYPQTAAVFTEYGLHCVGCQVAFWETLEQGARGHGMDDETITRMIDEANEMAQHSMKGIEPAVVVGVQVTEVAAEKIKEHMKKAKKEDYMLRIQVVKGGCAGQSYNFFFVNSNSAKADDQVIEKNGVKIVVDQESYGKLSGATIDFVDTLQGSGFKVNNPQASHTCGCGSSFS